MESDLKRRRPDTFVVQVTTNARGELTGLVRHVATGEKRRFERLEDLGTAVRSMVSTGSADIRTDEA